MCVSLRLILRDDVIVDCLYYNIKPCRSTQVYTESQVNPTAREREKIELNCPLGI